MRRGDREQGPEERGAKLVVKGGDPGRAEENIPKQMHELLQNQRVNWQ